MLSKSPRSHPAPLDTSIEAFQQCCQAQLRSNLGPSPKILLLIAPLPDSQGKSNKLVDSSRNSGCNGGENRIGTKKGTYGNLAREMW